MNFLSGFTNFLSNPEVVKIVKQLTLLLFVVGALTFFSGSFVFPSALPYIAGFFVAVRSFVMPFDFMIDTDTLITLLGMAFAVQISIWLLRAYFSLVNFLNER
jgi:hypothetical protein